MANTLAASKIWHMARIYPPNRVTVEKLVRAMFKFIWSGKTELVRREVCQSDFQYGGLRAVNIEKKSAY